MNKLILALMTCLLPFLPSVAKKLTPEQQKANEIMQNSDVYIYGIGVSEDSEEAYDAAIHDMVRKISITVRGVTHSESSEELSADGRSNSTEKFKSVLDSYTTPASLEGVQLIILKSGPEYEKFVYMPKANVDKMHDRRRYNVENLARDGVRARNNGKIDDALRHLYRAYVLLQSLPTPSDVFAHVDDGYHKLDTWIPEEMGNIMSKMKFGIASVSKDENDADNSTQAVELTVKYDDRPVTTCTFKYGTQSGYSSLITARDGVAEIDLDFSVSVNPLKLYVEYQFKNENHVNAELKPLLDTFKGSGLVNNEFAINGKSKTLKAEKKETRDFQEAISGGSREGIASLDNLEAAPYENVMEIILNAIRTGNYNGINQYFTADGLNVFDRLIRYGKVKILGNAMLGTYMFYPFREKVMCRSIPMSFTFSGGRQFTENVTFTFNKDAKVESVAFGLGSIARKDIFAKQGVAWTDDKKMVLVNFLENYRTAFALKELDYIESIFDDDAVIIVGHVTHRLEKVQGVGDAMGFASKEQVTYAQKSKKEYMEQLRRCFGSQEYINLRFSDTDVERSGIGGETYALQLKQDYVSRTYGDQGYLFLFIDFNDEDKPLIHIRTWQPERNPDLTPNLPPDHPRAGIFTPSSF